MKICILNHNLREQATWHRTWNAARHLQAAGHETTFVTVHPKRRLWPRRYVQEGVHVWEMPYFGPRRLAASGLDPWDILWRVMMVLFRPWDLLYGFDSLPNVGIPFLVARRLKPRKKFLADWGDLFCDGGLYDQFNHGLLRPLYLFERWLEKRTKIAAQGVTAVSHFLMERAAGFRGDRNVMYFPNGPAVWDLPPANRDEAHRRMQVPSGRLVVFYLQGGFNRDFPFLMQALVIALPKAPELYVVCTGDGDPRFMEAARQFGVEESVRATGFLPRSEMLWWMVTADIFAMPLADNLNNRARLPGKLLDYFYAGRPTVATGLGEVAWIMNRYSVGRLAGESPESFADQLVALAKDPGERERLGAEAARIVRTEFSWEKRIMELSENIGKWCQ